MGIAKCGSQDQRRQRVTAGSSFSFVNIWQRAGVQEHEQNTLEASSAEKKAMKNDGFRGVKVALGTSRERSNDVLGAGDQEQKKGSTRGTGKSKEKSGSQALKKHS